MITTVHTHSNVKRSLESLDSLLKRVANSNASVYEYENEAYVSSSLFTLFRNLNINEPIGKLILSLLKESCYKSELSVGVSTQQLILFVMHLLEVAQQKFTGNMFKLEQELTEYCNEFICEIESEGFKPQRAELDEILNKLDLDIRDIFKETIEVGGLNGNIYVSDIIRTKPSIDFVDGYVFKTKLELVSGDKSLSLSSPKVLVIDGIAERVSELNILLERLNKENTPCIIFARGFGEEVIQTLQINYVRKTLNVIPISIPSDIDTLNTLKDIAVVTGTRFISPLQGDIISMAKFEDLAYIDGIKIDKNSTTISCNKTSHAVDIHIKALQKRIDEEDLVEDIKGLLRMRIRSLTSSYVNVFLDAKNKHELLNKREKFTSALRGLSTAFLSGVVRKRCLRHPLSLLITDDIVYAQQTATALRFALSAALSIFSIKSVVTLQQ